MRINSKWIKTDFKQKYYILCNKCKFEVNKFADIKNKPYICRIKIEEV